MEKQNSLDFITWLNKQIDNANHVIRESQENSNFGREAKYEGVREAFLECLNKLTFVH